MAKPGKRRDFLERVCCRDPSRTPPLRTDGEFARDHVEAACSALALRLVTLVPDEDGGYEFRITRAGRLLLDGFAEAAAEELDRGRPGRPFYVTPPWALLTGRLRIGGPGMSLGGAGARAYAPQIIAAVAGGHAVVVGDRVLRNANLSRFPTPPVRLPDERVRVEPARAGVSGGLASCAAHGRNRSG